MHATIILTSWVWYLKHDVSTVLEQRRTSGGGGRLHSPSAVGEPFPCVFVSNLLTPTILKATPATTIRHIMFVQHSIRRNQRQQPIVVGVEEARTKRGDGVMELEGRVDQ
jgi:hypothetical protein